LYCNEKVKFKSKTIGYQKFCSNSCSTKASKVHLTNKMLNIYGVQHPSSIPHNIEKRNFRKIEFLKNMINKEGEFVKYDIKTGLVTLKCLKCNKLQYTSYDVLRQRSYLKLSWQDCITSALNTSSVENELRNFIQSLYSGVIVFNDKKILPSKREIDIYLPDLNIGFEFNGIWWHNEINKPRDYHYEKWSESYKLGINLIQIYEDERKFKKNIIKSRIRHILGKTQKRIYARKCLVKQINNKEIVDTFIIQNHLIGPSNSTINFGLYFQNELVSLMCFHKRNNNRYELLRFCSKLDSLVIGSVSKMFNHFIRNYEPDSIFTESPNEWQSLAYTKLGMKLRNIRKKNFWFINNGIRTKENSSDLKIWGAGIKYFEIEI